MTVVLRFFGVLEDLRFTGGLEGPAFSLDSACAFSRGSTSILAISIGNARSTGASRAGDSASASLFVLAASAAAMFSTVPASAFGREPVVIYTFAPTFTELKTLTTSFNPMRTQP